MSETTSRMRMFAGPNGSGKSTLKSALRPELLGAYINPDEIEEAIRTSGCLAFADYGVSTNRDEALLFFRNSEFLHSAGLTESARQLQFARVPAWFKRAVLDKVAPGRS